MEEKALLIILSVILMSNIAFAEDGEIIRELINPPHTEGAIFYKDGKEVARELFGENTNRRVELIGKIPDGKVKQYVRGNLYMEFEYKNNELNGITRGFYPDGTVSAEENYKNGKLDGITKTYSPNGNLTNEINYKNGQKHGENTGYFYSYSDDPSLGKNYYGYKYYEQGVVKIIAYFEEDVLKSRKKYYKDGSEIEF